MTDLVLHLGMVHRLVARIGQTFEVMAPLRRATGKAPPGQGERFSSRRAAHGRLDVQGDRSLLSRYFALVPPL